MSMYCVACDLGGTNITIGLLTFSHNKQNKFPVLLAIEKYKSKDFPSIIEPIKNAMKIFSETYSISSPILCISASGPITKGLCTPSNLPRSYILSQEKLETEYNTKVYLINDFSAISYGITTMIDQKKIYHIPDTAQLHYNTDQPHSFHSFAIVGAGTGLGTSQAHSYNHMLFTQAGEGGWMDFSLSADSFSYKLYDFASHSNLLHATNTAFKHRPVCWEDIISGGRGIFLICNFLKEYWKNRVDIDIAYLTHLISNTESHNIGEQLSIDAQNDNTSSCAVLEVWSYLYARSCNNLTIFGLFDALFLAGGIAAKNIWLFAEPYKYSKCLPQKSFADSFTKGYNKTISNLLKRVPLYIITDYNVSLYGCAFFIQQKMQRS